MEELIIYVHSIMSLTFSWSSGWPPLNRQTPPSCPEPKLLYLTSELCLWSTDSFNLFNPLHSVWTRQDLLESFCLWREKKWCSCWSQKSKFNNSNPNVYYCYVQNTDPNHNLGLLTLCNKHVFWTSVSAKKPNLSPHEQGGLRSVLKATQYALSQEQQRCMTNISGGM